MQPFNDRSVTMPLQDMWEINVVYYMFKVLEFCSVVSSLIKQMQKMLYGLVSQQILQFYNISMTSS